MSNDGEAGGFWRSIPGILTAGAGIVSAMAGLVIALTQAGVIGSGPGSAAAESAPEAPSAAVDGTWTAQVTYPWNATHAESFTFRVEDGRVYGEASYLEYPRGIEEGRISGDRITFFTRAEEILGDERRAYENRYDGRIAPRGIQFSLQDTRGEGPIEFTAVRKSD